MGRNKNKVGTCKCVDYYTDENNDFYVKSNISSRKPELITVDFKFRNGYFQTDWKNINITNSDYYQFIKKLRQAIINYYKKKKNTNVLIKPPEYLLFDLKAFDAKAGQT